MDERESRIGERADCEIAARVELSDRLAIACTVRDLSTTGVKIQISETVHLPDEFDLLIPVIEGVDQRHRIRTVWRTGDMMGGEFVSPTHVQ